MQETRRKQLIIRGTSDLQGQLVARPKGSKKPKGSKNVQKKVHESAAEREKEAEFSVEETLRGEKLKNPPMVDFNSSFDDIDTAFFYNGESAYESEVPKVIFRAPVQSITFNPVSSKLNDIASQLLPSRQLDWREREEEDSLSDCTYGRPISAETDAIFRG